MDAGADVPEGEISVLGRHPSASNVVLVAELRAADLEPMTVSYKPIAGERPLWDFPDGSLAAREVAASRIDALGGFDLVPATVLREGPVGPGSIQRWVGDVTTPPVTPIAVTPPEEVPPDNIVVLAGEDDAGAPLVLSHPDDARLRSMAVLDAVLNNSDRKGGHVLVHEGRLWGIDHGVSLHTDPKLRTVLWGWAGEELTAEDRGRLTRLATALEEPAAERSLQTLITPAEVEALRGRVAGLLSTNTHPEPSGGWPAIPWPPL